MPELPEVEQIRRTLAAHIVGLVVGCVRVRRPDVIRSSVARRNRSLALLRDGRFKAVHRHGKRLALEVQDGRVLEFGLGMTGQFILEPPFSRAAASEHRHVLWSLRDSAGDPAVRLIWRDPRRFGGLHPIHSMTDLRGDHWAHHGPDALEITKSELFSRLTRTTRALKAALLDQHLLAGVGNIYADEALYRARLRPDAPANHLSRRSSNRLHSSIQHILAQAIEAGGSTIRDHRTPLGCSGSYQTRHAVYGRSGADCEACGEAINSTVIAGRTTHWCPHCQL